MYQEPGFKVTTATITTATAISSTTSNTTTTITATTSTTSICMCICMCMIVCWRGQIVFRFLLAGFLSKSLENQWVLNPARGEPTRVSQ